MGSRAMFHHLGIETKGYKFEKIVSRNELCVVLKRKRIRTTDGLYEKMSFLFEIPPNFLKFSISNLCTELVSVIQ